MCNNLNFVICQRVIIRFSRPLKIFYIHFIIPPNSDLSLTFYHILSQNSILRLSKSSLPTALSAHIYTLSFNTISSAHAFILSINPTHFIRSCIFSCSVTPCFFSICFTKVSTCSLVSWSTRFRCAVSSPQSSINTGIVPVYALSGTVDLSYTSRRFERSIRCNSCKNLLEEFYVSTNVSFR